MLMPVCREKTLLWHTCIFRSLPSPSYLVQQLIVYMVDLAHMGETQKLPAQVEVSSIPAPFPLPFSISGRWNQPLPTSFHLLHQRQWSSDCFHHRCRREERKEWGRGISVAFLLASAGTCQACEPQEGRGGTAFL